MAWRIAPAARSVQYCEVCQSRTAFRIPSSIFSASRAGVLLRVVADEDRLTERDGVGDLGNGGVRARSCLGGALIAVLLEPVGPLLGALDQ